MKYPLFEMSEEELITFLTIVHRDHSSEFMCHKDASPISLRNKIRKALTAFYSDTWRLTTLEDAMTQGEGIGEEFMSTKGLSNLRYRNRVKWTTALLDFNNAQEAFYKLHKFYGKVHDNKNARKTLVELIKWTDRHFYINPNKVLFINGGGFIESMLHLMEEFVYFPLKEEFVYKKLHIVVR